MNDRIPYGTSVSTNLSRMIGNHRNEKKISDKQNTVNIRRDSSKLEHSIGMDSPTKWLSSNRSRSIQCTVFGLYKYELLAIRRHHFVLSCCKWLIGLPTREHSRIGQNHFVQILEVSSKKRSVNKAIHKFISQRTQSGTDLGLGLG